MKPINPYEMSHLTATIKETNANAKQQTNKPQSNGWIYFKSPAVVYLLRHTVYCHSSFSALQGFFFSHDLQILHHLNIASSHLIYGLRCLLKLSRKLLQSSPTLTCQVSLFQSCNPMCENRDRKITFERKVRGDTARTWCLTLATVGLPGLGSISRYRKQCEGATRQYWQSAAI